MPLMVKLARRSAPLPVVGCSAVTTTLIWGKRSASKKSAEQQVRVAAADARCAATRVRMSRRPNTAPLPVSWPSPLNSVKWPLTFSQAPHVLDLEGDGACDPERGSIRRPCRDRAAVFPESSSSPHLCRAESKIDYAGWGPSRGAISAGSKYSSMRLIRPSAPTLITMQTRMEIDWPAWPVPCRMCCWTNPPMGPSSKSWRSRIS